MVSMNLSRGGLPFPGFLGPSFPARPGLLDRFGVNVFSGDDPSDGRLWDGPAVRRAPGSKPDASLPPHGRRNSRSASGWDYIGYDREVGMFTGAETESCSRPGTPASRGRRDRAARPALGARRAAPTRLRIAPQKPERPNSLASSAFIPFLLTNRVWERTWTKTRSFNRKTRGPSTSGPVDLGLWVANPRLYLTAPTAHPVEPGARRGRCRSALPQERGGESASGAILRARSLARAGVRAPRSCLGGSHGTFRGA